jgi:hypothetical protein
MNDALQATSEATVTYRKRRGKAVTLVIPGESFVGGTLVMRRPRI